MGVCHRFLVSFIKICLKCLTVNLLSGWMVLILLARAFKVADHERAGEYTKFLYHIKNKIQKFEKCRPGETSQ